VPKALYYGDNLDVLRNSIGDKTVDLVYLDPPFNSAADYNVLFKEHSGIASRAQNRAFTDTWQWGRKSMEAMDELMQRHGELAEFVDFTVRRLGHNTVSAYLTMMAIRLIELHRVLKPTGSLYLHCDPTASHYLKAILDVIFGPKNFRNEIIWKRSHSHNSAKKWGPVHDTILFYSRSSRYHWADVRMPYEQEYLDRYFKFDDEDGRGRYWTGDLTGAGVRHGETGLPWRGFDPTEKGRHWAYTHEKLEALDADKRIYWPPTPGAWPKLKRYLAEARGVPIQDVITDITALVTMGGRKQERLGYPTQKPVELLERIINASSREGDVVLDPFCGCGTATDAAEKLGRDWIGIDVTYIAIDLIERRLEQNYGLKAGRDYVLDGAPEDVESARYLFEQVEDGPYQFQFWAVGVIGAQPHGAGLGGKKGKKGGDGGIDGVLYFRTPDGAKLEKVIVSVKGGKSLNPGMIRDLESVVRREKAAMGVFLSLEEPTAGMRQEAAKHGLYHYESESYPVIQILTVAELLAGRRPAIPRGAANVSLERRDVMTVDRDKRSKTMRPLFVQQDHQ
jgi:DNA modification methylase